VTVALEVPPSAAVVAVKFAELAAAGTVTEAGTVSREVVLARVIAAPPVGAGWDRVTVQVVEVFGPRLVGLHDKDETSPEAAKLRVVVAELPL
jgi:hypothetical protein